MYVDPQAAVRAANATSGFVRLDLTSEQLQLLSPEEREELATAPGLGEESCPAHDLTGWENVDMHLGPTVEGGHVFGQRKEEAVAEATFDSLRGVLAARLRRREAQRLEHVRYTEEFRERAEAFLARHEALPDEQLALALPMRAEDAASLPGEPSSFERSLGMWAGVGHKPAAWKAHPELRARIQSVEHRRRLLYRQRRHEAWERAKQEQRETEARLAEERRAQREEAAHMEAALADCVQAHGNESQRVRAARAQLPRSEALGVVADHLFSRVLLPPFEPFRRGDVKHTKRNCKWEEVDINHRPERMPPLPEAEEHALALLSSALQADGIQLTPALRRATCKWCGAQAHRYTVLALTSWNGQNFEPEFALVRPRPTLRVVSAESE